MSNYRLLIACPAIVLGMLLVAACGGDSDDEQTGVPSADEQAAFCRTISQTRASLDDFKAAASPPDAVALQDARMDINASVEYLYSTSLNLQGGTDLVADLRADMNEFNRLLATPDLAAAVPDLQAQAQVIENDLDQMEAAGNCP